LTTLNLNLLQNVIPCSKLKKNIYIMHFVNLWR
jgi:hypothetical protein